MMGLSERAIISQDGYLLKQYGKVRNSKYTNKSVRKILINVTPNVKFQAMIYYYYYYYFGGY